VDYLGLVTHEKLTKASLYERTTLVSQGLKALAMDLQIPVLCAVQFNREAATGGRPVKPSLAFFRDSGAIEQDCDIALLIHQTDSTADSIQEGDCELIVAKQRNGWTGSVPLQWRASCARFEDTATEAAA
jgi:replicative DNA helicase